MENPILKIDFTTLRTQKTSLLAAIEYFEKNKVPQLPDDLTGILHLIDSIQDYAVDELGVSAMHVFDFELEEERENETPEEKFARENAEIIFQMHIEGTVLYDEESSGMPKEFVEKIVDDPMHSSLIKNLIRRDILNDVSLNPDNFDRDENGKLTYSADMYDYGFTIEEYCKEKFDGGKTKAVYLCPHCGSDNVESKSWVNPNTNEVKDSDTGDDDYCNDCEQHGELLYQSIPIRKKVVGFQVVDEDNGDIHPQMDGSFCIYSLPQAKSMLDDTVAIKENWKILTIWSGDVEKPTMMFEGDPRNPTENYPSTNTIG